MQITGDLLTRGAAENVSAANIFLCAGEGGRTVESMDQIRR